MFIRKLLDFIFTKRELSWLDDLMPEWKKKKLEDAQEEVFRDLFRESGSRGVYLAVFKYRFLMLGLFDQEEHSIIAEEEGIVQVPLEGNLK